MSNPYDRDPRIRPHQRPNNGFQHYYGPSNSSNNGSPKIREWSNGEIGNDFSRFSNHRGNFRPSNNKRKYPHQPGQRGDPEDTLVKRKFSADPRALERSRNPSSESRSSSNPDIEIIDSNRNQVPIPRGSPPPSSSALPARFSHPSPAAVTPKATAYKVPIFCRLCQNDKAYKTDRDFATHLTIIHYRDRIMESVKPPYSCVKCHFTPPDSLSSDLKAEELLMHYGSEEGVAMGYYRKDCTVLPPETLGPTTHFESSKNSVVCKICEVESDNERLFIRHITLRHFTQQLVADLPTKAPFRCPYIDCNNESTTIHNLMLHYGGEHNLSMEMYRKMLKDLKDKDKDIPIIPTSPVAIAEVSDSPSPVLESGKNVTEQVQFSDEFLSNQKLVANKSSDLSPMNREEGKKVSSGGPERAKLQSEKSKTVSSSQAESSRSKYGGPKLINMFSPKPSTSKEMQSPQQDNVCPKCTTRKTFVTFKSLQYHIIIGHAFPTLPKIGPFKCARCNIDSLDEKPDFIKHVIEKHWDSYKNKSMPIPSNGLREKKKNSSSSTKHPRHEEKTPNSLPVTRIKQTLHNAGGEMSARQKIARHWESHSLDGLKQKVEDLEKEVKRANESKSEALEKKVKEFERWIKQKETALEKSSEESKELESKLEQANINIVDFKKQLEQSATKTANLEAMLEDKHNLNHELNKEKKIMEKRISSFAETEKEFEEQKQKDEQKDAELLSKLSAAEEKVNDMEIMLSEKDEEIKELNKNSKFCIEENEKKLGRLEKQLDSQKTKMEKLQEEKKEKNAAIKELTKKHKDVEMELKEQISTLTKENKLLASQGKKLEAKDSMKLEHTQQQLIDTESRVELLETERDVLLDTLDRLQRILQDYEVRFQEKSDKLKEMGCAREDAENNLDEALQKLKSQKEIEKEKRELNRQVKQLQNTLKEWEARQFTNVKLIAGLEKEIKDLKKKVKDFEENHTGAEEELYEMSTKIKQLKTEMTNLRSQADVAEQEKAKSMARLVTKNEEVDTLKSKNLELDVQVKILEKEIRQKGATVNDVELLQSELNNKKGEVTHLQRSLQDLQYNKTENERLKKEIATLKDRNSKFESDYSHLVAQYETTKKDFKDLRQLLVTKNNQLQKIKSTVQHQPTNSALETVSEFQIKKEVVDTDDIPPMPEFPQIPDSSFIQSSSRSPCVDATAGKQIILDMEKDLMTNVKEEETESNDDDDDNEIINPSVCEPVVPDHQYSMRAPVLFPHDPLSDRPAVPFLNSIKKGSSSSTSAKSHDEELRSFFPPDEQFGPIKFVGDESVPKSRYRPGPASSKMNLESRIIRDFAQASTAAAAAAAARSSDSESAEVLEEDDDAVCGICSSYDPPIQEGALLGKRYTTRWVGCECDRWFHKQCTKLKRVSDKFSCRSVKQKCAKPTGKIKKLKPELQ